MKTKEFVEKFNKLTNEENKGKLVKSIVKTDYLPFVEKCNVCQRIVKATYYHKGEDGVVRLHIDSASNYMLYCLCIVDEYTSIDVDFKDAIAEFDLLNKYGIIDIVSSYIPEKEMKELNMLLEMKGGDVLKNEYELHSFISNQVERFGSLIGINATPALEKLADAINNLDENKIEKIVKLIDKSDNSKILKMFNTKK